MKKLLIPALLLIAVASCNVAPAIEEPSDGSIFPEEIYVQIANQPQTKLSLGDYDAEKHIYPLSLDAGDILGVYGFYGDEARGHYTAYNSYLDNTTFEMQCRVTKTEDGRSILGRTSLSLSDGMTEEQAYAATKTFIVLSSVYYGLAISTSMDKTAMNRVIMYGNKFTKEEFEAFRSKWPVGTSSPDTPADAWLPVYIMNSVLHARIDASLLEKDRNMSSIFYGTGYYGSPDLEQLDEMLTQKRFIPAEEDNYKTSSYVGQVIHPGDCLDYYVAVPPGKTDKVAIGFTLEDDEYNLPFEVDMNTEFDFQPGYFYNITLRPTEEQLMLRPAYHPKFHYGGNKYAYDNSGYASWYDTGTFAIDGLLKAGVGIVRIPGLGEAADFDSSVAGKIALIKRGTTSFVEKVTNARNAGAAGVIMANNTSGSISFSAYSEFYNYSLFIPAIGTEQGVYDGYSSSAEASIYDLGVFRSTAALHAGDYDFPLEGNPRPGKTAGESLSEIKGLLASAPVVFIPNNDFTGLDLAGKIALPEFTPMFEEQYGEMAVAAVAAGAAGLIVPTFDTYSLSLYVQDLNDVPEAASLPVVSVFGSFPSYYRAAGSPALSVAGGRGPFSLDNGGSLDDCFDD